MKKKAQAAMEFLMTYGWAILVVLVVIGALAYFGVLSPKKLLPDKCIFGPMILYLTNGFGDTITVSSATAKGTSCATVVSSTGTGAWTSGAKATLTFACTAGTAGDKTNEEVTIVYTKPGSALTHTVSGQVSISLQ
ncbi:MAG: hypothetical protein NT001_01140 [Candidatus Woesearchaeota archaeon]|nr:hypothetical protein [Candidatus Woesearchaeota archaeon]